MEETGPGDPATVPSQPGSFNVPETHQHICPCFESSNKTDQNASRHYCTLPVGIIISQLGNLMPFPMQAGSQWYFLFKIYFSGKKRDMWCAPPLPLWHSKNTIPVPFSSIFSECSEYWNGCLLISNICVCGMNTLLLLKHGNFKGLIYFWKLRPWHESPIEIKLQNEKVSENRTQNPWLESLYSFWGHTAPSMSSCYILKSQSFKISFAGVRDFNHRLCGVWLSQWYYMHYPFSIYKAMRSTINQHMGNKNMTTWNLAHVRCQILLECSIGIYAH